MRYDAVCPDNMQHLELRMMPVIENMHSTGIDDDVEMIRMPCSHSKFTAG